MNDGQNQTVVLGVCGSIAAHRAVDLCSLLSSGGVDVNVVMSRDAQKFVTALPFKTLSKNPVVVSLYDDEDGWRPTHIRLADEASLMIVAPATANIIAKLAQGLADDALTCIALALQPATRILVAPAMNGKMWNHPATRANVAVLKERGVEFIGPAEGVLACGYDGVGRLWEVGAIADRALQLASQG